MKKTLIFIFIIIGVVALIGILLSMPLFNTKESINEINSNQVIETELTGQIKEFNIIAKKWKFDPAEIRVNKGDKVVLNIKSIDVAHGISLRDFNVNEYLAPGQNVKIEFIAHKSGKFSFFCSVPCGIGHRGMSGVLIVN